MSEEVPTTMPTTCRLKCCPNIAVDARHSFCCQEADTAMRRAHAHDANAIESKPRRVTAAASGNTEVRVENAEEEWVVLSDCVLSMAGAVILTAPVKP